MKCTSSKVPNDVKDIYIVAEASFNLGLDYTYDDKKEDVDISTLHWNVHEDLSSTSLETTLLKLKAYYISSKNSTDLNLQKVAR